MSYPRCRTCLKTARSAPRWRPIVTAPKDEQILLLYPGHDHLPFVCQGRWVDVPHTNALNSWLQERGRELNSWDDPVQVTPDPESPVAVRPGWQVGYVAITSRGESRRRSYHGDSYLVSPTHWQPLPPPPARLPRGYSRHG